MLQALVRCEPDKVYNLAGQSSVGLSSEQPVKTMESNIIGTLNIREAIRYQGRPINFYSAGSSECFGDISEAAGELTPFRPRSPYAVAQAVAYSEFANYREAYDLFACSGILFNHESPLRPKRLVTRKIVASSCRVAAGKQDKRYLGNISVQRDWGVGAGVRGGDVDDAAARLVGLEWRDHVVIDPALTRPTDLSVGRANPAKAFQQLGWRARYRMRDVVRKMVEAEQTLQHE